MFHVARTTNPAATLTLRWSRLQAESSNWDASRRHRNKILPCLGIDFIVRYTHGRYVVQVCIAAAWSCGANSRSNTTITQHCLCSRWRAKTPGASSLTHNTHYSMRAMVVCPATTLAALQSGH